MAEKETNSTKNTTAKTTVKVTAKPAATTAPKTTATTAPKTTATAKPAATTAPKTTATAKPAATTAPKTTATTKPAATTAPKTTATTAPKTTATAKTSPVEENKVAATVNEEKPKKEKTAKSVKTTEGGSSAKAKVAAIVKTDNFRIFGIIGLSLILLLCLCLGMVFGLRSCTGMNGILMQKSVTVNANKQLGLVGYYSENIGTVERVKPVEGVHDEGLATGYPVYGYTKSLTPEQKNAILAENKNLCAKPTSNTGGVYDWMDEEGYLYTGTRTEGALVTTSPNRLYQHTGSVGLYLGDVSDEEQAVIKSFTFRPRRYSSYYNVTGLYAPAGEVIKIQLSAADMDATGGVTIHIGQALYNGQANNIWSARNFNRMPVILNTMYVTKNTAVYDEETGLWTAYVGSFLGGPIYVRDESVTFSVTVSGGVPYSHFILGVTTEEEFNATKNSSVPFFDLEVWDNGVLHSGPKRYAQSFSYEDIYKAAVLWEKVSTVTTYNNNQGIVFLYDPFVAAGAAVAFPGRRSVNCPMSWMSSSLNYNAIVTSGAWGNFHEYHHNFQNYGVGYTGEVTNNGLNLVSYSLFTNISSARQVSGYGGAGLSGWNQYTSATWALYRVNSGSIGGTNGLAVYATLLHNLGQDAYIKTRGSTGSAYYDKWATYTHQDMTFYASLVSSYGGTYTPSQTVKDANYPLFVPVSSVYQTGRTYNYDGEKREITTMQPFVIPYGKTFTFDLNPYEEHLNTDGAFNGQYKAGSVVIANGFTYTIKSVNSDGANGSVRRISEGVYEFTPNTVLNSGKIYVTLEITTTSGAKEWNGHALEDVDLIIEFQQSHESNKATLERTIYTYDQNPYTSATQAYEQKYAGYKAVETIDNKNYSQNSNTDIWLYPERYADDATYGQYVYPLNSIMELKGKLYFPEAGRYRIYLRGRIDCALYLSTDGGKTYFEAAHIDRNDNLGLSATFFPNNEKTYYDVNVAAESWVYFKEVLIVEPASTNMSYIGLGIGTWTTPLYNPKTDAEGNIVTDADGNPIYVDESGKEVSAEQAANAELIAPKTVSYATAYRQSYEFKKEFTSDYFYVKQYGYTYKDNLWQNPTQELVSYTNYTPYDKNRDKVEYLVDGNKNTYIHTNFTPSASRPLEFVVDMGDVKPVNRMIIYTQYRPNGDWHVAKVFTLYGSVDGEEFFEVFATENAPASGGTVTVNFDEAEFRYYKLVITGSTGQYVIITEIEMWRIKEIAGNGDNTRSPDDSMFTYKGNWRLEYCNSDFGHVYVGEKATVEFEFTGTRFAINASKYYGRNYEVYVDGKLLESDDVKEDDSDYAIVYMTPALSEGKHKVVIYCKEEGNIDSILVW